MGASLTYRSILGALTIPRRQRGVSVESYHREIKPQYHVLSEDYFTTVPYMVAGTLPPNWEDVFKHSCETATAEDIDLADSSVSAVADIDADKDQHSNPFVIVTDPTKRQKTEARGSSKENLTIQDPPISDETTSGTRS